MSKSWGPLKKLQDPLKKPLCKLAFCRARAKSRGLCGKHYERFRAGTGHPLQVFSKAPPKFKKCMRLDCNSKRDMRRTVALCSKHFQQYNAEQLRLFRLRHPEKNPARCRDNYLKNRARRIEWQKEYYWKNKKRLNAKAAQRQKQRRKKR